MIVVLDTNILVSALLSPFGPPGRIVDLALRENWKPGTFSQDRREGVQAMAPAEFLRWRQSEQSEG